MLKHSLMENAAAVQPEGENRGQEEKKEEEGRGEMKKEQLL